MGLGKPPMQENVMGQERTRILESNRAVQTILALGIGDPLVKNLFELFVDGS